MCRKDDQSEEQDLFHLQHRPVLKPRMSLSFVNCLELRTDEYKCISPDCQFISHRMSLDEFEVHLLSHTTLEEYNKLTSHHGRRQVTKTDSVKDFASSVTDDSGFEESSQASEANDPREASEDEGQRLWLASNPRKRPKLEPGKAW